MPTTTQLAENAGRSGEDRRRSRRYRFDERRSGFDRRRRYPVLGTIRDSDAILIGLLVALNLTSLLDGVLTAYELWLGIAHEGNPVLAALIEVHPFAAVAVKVGATALVSVIIWRGRRFRLILGLAVLSLAVFTTLVAYHLGALRGFGIV